MAGPLMTHSASHFSGESVVRGQASWKFAQHLGQESFRCVRSLPLLSPSRIRCRRIKENSLRKPMLGPTCHKNAAQHYVRLTCLGAQILVTFICGVFLNVWPELPFALCSCPNAASLSAQGESLHGNSMKFTQLAVA